MFLLISAKSLIVDFSQSVAFANLLAGRTDTLVVSTTKAWDILPGIFMAEEAGFQSYNYN